MLIDQFHTYFRLKADKSNTLQYASWLAEEIDYWLNVAITAFQKTRYSGTNAKQESFEQTQKRMADLRTMIVEASIDTFKDSALTDKPYCYIAELPTDYFVAVGEEVTFGYRSVNNTTRYTTSAVLPAGTYIVDAGTVEYQSITYIKDELFTVDGTNTTTIVNASVEAVTTTRQGVYNTTSDSYRTSIDNPFSEHYLHYNWARPLRMFKNTYVELVADENYGIQKYHLRYLKAPATVSFFTQTVTSGNILPLIQYKVITATGAGNYVTYNGTNYTNNQIFVGQVGITTFTTTGTVVSVRSRIECDLPEHTHEEVLTLAARMAFANTDNMQQYQTTSAEYQQME